jgi:hypothetical protein
MTQFTAENVLYLIGAAEDAAEVLLEEADDQDASEAGWGDENRDNAKGIECIAEAMRPYAEEIAALVNGAGLAENTRT